MTFHRLVLLALLAVPGSMLAQGGPPGGAPAGGAPPAGAVTGTVVNEAGQPITSGSAALRSVRDSALVNGALMSATGTFRVDAPPGRYFITIRALGFAPVVRGNITVTPAEPRVDLGTVKLTAVATQLGTVDIVGEREVAELAPDRNSYTMKDMPSASSGNVVEVLRHVPGVEVDGDNKVSLRGNQNVVVQINGRPTPMRGDQLGNFLAQLPANMVERVEVVPNPSAKDDPEGMAGIVNVVLKQNADLGTSGGLSVAAGSTGQVNASGNLGHQAGPWTLFGSYGFMRDDRRMSGFTNRTNLFLDPRSYLFSDNRGAFTPLSHSATANIEYKFTPRVSLSTNLLLSSRNMERENTNEYRALDASFDTTGRSLQLSLADNDGLTADASLLLKRTVQALRDEVSAEVRFNRSGGQTDMLLTDQQLSLDGTRLPQPGLETNLTEEVLHNLTLQTDVIRPLGTRAKMEFGYKGIMRRQENDLGVALFSYAEDRYVPELSRSNQFDYDDNIHAVYGMLSRNLGKTDVQAGLRAERVDTRFALQTTGEQFENDYTSLFPSGIVSYNLNERQQVKASYSKRVTRPHTGQLNPFGFREDALNQFRGNPYLKPEYTHAMELGYQQSFSRGSLQLSPFYRHTVDAVRMIRTVDDAGVSVATFQNVATNDSYGADANASLRMTKLSGFGGMSVFRTVTDASNLSTDVSTNSIGWSARGNVTYKVTPRLDAQGFVMYRAPMNTEQGRILSMMMTNIALRQKVQGERGNVTLRIMDPFKTMRFGFTGSDGRVLQESRREFGMRGVYLGYGYNFGRPPRLRPRAQEPEVTQPGLEPGVGPS